MDILTKGERSRRMSGVRLKGNRSTEWRLRAALMASGIRGWKTHPRTVQGVPDFVFPRLKLAIFVDGCFWHCCPYCARRMPRSNRRYWAPKLRANVTRARRINQQLCQDGYAVVRIWEHELRRTRPLSVLLARLSGQALDQDRRDPHEVRSLRLALRMLTKR